MADVGQLEPSKEDFLVLQKTQVMLPAGKQVLGCGFLGEAQLRLAAQDSLAWDW